MESRTENELILLELTFENKSYNLEDEQLCDLLKLLGETTKENEQKNYIREIVDFYKSCVDQNLQNLETRNVLIEFFTKYSSKKVLRKYLQDVIGELNVSTSLVKSAADEILSNINNNKCCNIKQCYDLVNFVNLMQITDNFQYEVTIEYLFPLYYMLFEGFVFHSTSNFEVITSFHEELFTLMSVVFKQILFALSKVIPFTDTISKDYSIKLIVLSHTLLMNENIAFDFKTKSSLIITYCCNIVPEIYSSNFKYKECPSLELVVDFNDKGYFLLSNHKLEVFTQIESIISIFASILSVLPKDKLIAIKINDSALVYILFNGLITCAQKKAGIAHLTVETSRTLSILVKHMVDVPPNLIQPLFVEALAYIWSHIDHFVDTVRNYTKQFFAGMVMLAAHHNRNGLMELTHLLLLYVRQLPANQNIRYLAIEYMTMYLGPYFLLTHLPDLLDILLIGISDPSVSDQACKAYICIMEKHFGEVERDEWIRNWVIPITKVLKNCNKCSTSCQRIIIRAFQLHPVILKTIYPVDYIGNPQESTTLLKCLHYARLHNMESSPDRRENRTLYWRGLIDKEKLMKYAVHQEDAIRITALAVIVDTHKSTELYVDWELDYLLMFLHYNVSTQVTNTRKLMITYFKKAITRYNTGVCVLKRSIATLNNKIKAVEDSGDAVNLRNGYQEIYAFYQLFIEKFTKLLVSYLTYDSNYYRRATSLELLIAVQQFLSKDLWLRCWREDDVKNCHNILFDTYETNKKMTVILLRTLPPAAMGFTNTEFTHKYLQRCLIMARDIKPNKTLSAAYLLEVCTFSPWFNETMKRLLNNDQCRLASDSKLNMIVFLIAKLSKKEVNAADILEMKTSNHGILFSIRHLLERRDISSSNAAYADIFEHITNTCLKMRKHLLPIVSGPAPEGFIPECTEELSDKDVSSGAQKILSFAWRTIKETTLLLAEIVKQTILLESRHRMLEEIYLINIGGLFFKIFVESRHRGVFEKAFVGFSAICQSYWMCSKPNINILPKIWLADALDFCTGVTPIDSLCTTRRSAGLPYLILAVLSTEPGPHKPNFHETMKRLLEMCERDERSYDEYRTHCMNVLRMIFRDSKLGEAVSCYVAAGMKVVLKCFTSSSWGIRNSATLLFSSLITRMFGVQRTQNSEELSVKNRLTVRVFFLRYPELYQYMLDLLKEDASWNESLVLHPLLMILARLYPSQVEEYNIRIHKYMEQYLHYVTEALVNPVYRTRYLAAKSSVPLIPTDHASDYINKCLTKLQSTEVGDNECQGFLLQIKHILKSNHTINVPSATCLKESTFLLQQAGKRFSHMTVAFYMEVLLLILIKFKEFDNIDVLKEIMTQLSRQITSNLVPLTAMDKFMEIRMLLILFIIVDKFEECEVTYPTITNQIMSQLYGHDIEMKKYCLNLLIYMNQVLNDGIPKHPLYQMEEMQIQREIVMLVDTFSRDSIRKILIHIHPYLSCFLTEELKFQHYIKKEDQVLLFLLLNYYPCVIKYLNLSKQETLNMLIKFCDCDNEELVSAVVSCISTFLLQLDYTVLIYEELIEILTECASPAASDYRRMAVCDFLSKNYILYCNEDPILKGDDLQMILNIVMILLEDDELMVRNAMSNFASVLKIRITLNKNVKQTISGHRWALMPERAREDLLNLCRLVLPKDRAISFLFSWACRHFPDTSLDTSEVFERGEVNLYAENVSFMELCISLLKDLLWSLKEEELSYEDKSIFIEEHTLLVSTMLLDSLEKHQSPMMLYKTKLSVICALKSTTKFLERYDIYSNFIEEFKDYLENTIITGYLTRQVEHSDLFSVKKVIREIFEPVFNYEKK